MARFPLYTPRFQTKYWEKRHKVDKTMDTKPSEQPSVPDLERIQRPLLIRIALVILGTVLVLGGLIGLLLPIIPGWLLIIAGLAVLATEFVWARRLLDAAKQKAQQVRAKVPMGKKKTPAG